MYITYNIMHITLYYNRYITYNTEFHHVYGYSLKEPK